MKKLPLAILGLLLAILCACNAAPSGGRFGTSYPTPTDSGIPVIVNGHYRAAAIAGDAGQVLTWDGGPYWGAASGGGSGIPNGYSGLRLSLTTGVPDDANDVTGATSIFLTPTLSGGGQLSTYVSSVWTPTVTTEISLALSALTTGKLYDLFVACPSTCSLSKSSAWTNDTTRADALGTQDGVTVLASDHSKLWVGLFRATNTTTTERSALKSFLWNARNQTEWHLLVTDTTDSWTYNTAAFRPSNNNTANAWEYITGDAMAHVFADALGFVSSSVASNCSAGVGVDSTTVNSAQLHYGASLGGPAIQRATYDGAPGLGWHRLTWLENGGGTTTMTWGGDYGAAAFYQAGMRGVVRN